MRLLALPTPALDVYERAARPAAPRGAPLAGNIRAAQSGYPGGPSCAPPPRARRRLVSTAVSLIAFVLAVLLLWSETAAFLTTVRRA